MEVNELRKRYGPAVALDGMSAARATLEEAYLQLTHDAVEFRAAAVEEATR